MGEHVTKNPESATFFILSRIIGRGICKPCKASFLATERVPEKEPLSRLGSLVMLLSDEFEAMTGR